jgi:hypothetical protein
MVVLCEMENYNISGDISWRIRIRYEGCQMVYFQNKNPNLGKFWRALGRKMLMYFTATGNILQTFGIFYYHWVHFVFLGYIFAGFGIMYQEKSGNLARYNE